MLDRHDEETPALWWVLVRDASLFFTLFTWTGEWYVQDGWRHWVAYGQAFALAWLLLDAARGYWRRFAARRDTPTIQL